MSPRICVFVATLVAFAACSASVAEDEAAVTIERVQWGFDGKAPPRTFVPLSVLVRNHTPLEFDGALTLTKLIQSSKPIDASIVRSVYIGPLSSRWVQFVPYVVNDWEQWRLAWGPAENETFDIATPAIGEPATVLLYDPDDLQLSGGVLRRFATNLFPASVTGTDALRGVALDRPPRWQGSRRQAFLEWLHLGGRVYLLQDEQGRFPQFPAALGVLNSRSDRYHVGAGLVRRVPQSVRELEPDFVKEQLLSDRPSDTVLQRWQQFRQSPSYVSAAPMLNRTGWDRDTQMFLDLQSITRFARQWWIIYLMALLYLLALFPLCYRIGREARDYRWTYVALLLAVGVFSYGFASLSRLGASETSRTRAVAVARQLSDGVYDVTQWTCVGVRAAGDYAIEHEGTGVIYTTSQDMERIDGTIVAGTSARMELDIPPASTRSVLHRARVEATPLGLRVTQIVFDNQGLEALAVQVGPEFPSRPMVLLAAHEGRLYEMRQIGDLLQLVPSTRKPLVSYLIDYFQVVRTINVMGGTTPRLDENAGDQEVYRTMLRTLVGNSFGLGDYVDPAPLTLSPRIVRLFAFAPMPQSLGIRGESFPDQAGYVLYVADLPAQVGEAP